jgi:hypothetical protein
VVSPYFVLYSYRKRNAIIGNLAAFFLVEVMNDALNEISDRGMDSSTLLLELQAQEDADYAHFLNAKVTDDIFRRLVDDESDREGVDFSLMVKGHNFCHTARLPAEIRNKGILTESFATGYDKGRSQTEADTAVNEDGWMGLVYSENERQETCDATLNVDFSDYFYSKTRDDWKLITLPNDAEMQAYGNDEPLQGLLVICFAACRWKKCPRGNLDREAFDEGLFEMTVNKQTVSRLVKFGDCELLQNSDGYKWSPNGVGKFDFRARVLAPNSFLRIGSFIFW